MLKKTPDDARSRLKDAAFAYTEEQWAEIERSLRHLNPSQADLESAREKLERAARSYRLQGANAPTEKAQRKWLVRHWTRIAELSAELERLVIHVSVCPGPPGDLWNELIPLECLERDLMKLKVIARERLAEPRDDDGFPKASPRAWFQFRVLETWTLLGGKLKYSRHPRTHKITGPLVRYYAAATQPVIGGSPESLPDILKRHKVMRAAINKLRVSDLAMDAESFAQAMAGATMMGLGDWAAQDEVQDLLKEAFRR
jgi:hypothetical protein